MSEEPMMNTQRMNLTRLSSGVPGLDEMIEGGFPFPSVILVSGSAGTGKTTFALKFLCEGAIKGERGLYFTTLSEPTQWMLRYSSQFDFLDQEYFDNDIIYADLGSYLMLPDSNKLLDAIDEKIAEVLPQRIVIDPITVVGGMLKDDYRSFLYDLTNRLKNWNATTIVTGEVKPDELYPPEISYAVDGIVLLMYSEEAGARR
ncbi:MAG: KaiA-binding protein, partial [Methanomassiliicoccales archaeon]|nr:KaiA-binding protein [Methanomassiliicoccales archaeon]